MTSFGVTKLRRQTKSGDGKAFPSAPVDASPLLDVPPHSHIATTSAHSKSTLPSTGHRSGIRREIKMNHSITSLSKIHAAELLGSQPPPPREWRCQEIDRVVLSRMQRAVSCHTLSQSPNLEMTSI